MIETMIWKKYLNLVALNVLLLKFTNDEIKRLEDQCKNRNLQTLAAFGEYLDLANLLHKSNIFSYRLKVCI